MKKIIPSFLFFLIAIMTVNTQAQNYTANNLSPELNAIVSNVQKECALNTDQQSKFKNDYVLFLNENAKPNANTNALFALLGLKIRGYLSEAQFGKITQMVKDGKLNPPGNKNDLTKQTPATSAPSITLTPSTGSVSPTPKPITTASNVTALFQQLESYMKISPDKAAQIVPILKDYDAQLTKIKLENTGNPAKEKQLTDALNGQAVPKLKMHMTDQQLATLVVALGMQENIINGKNLSAEQKTFLSKIRNQYGLNDVQTMSVILVLVQGKIRGDAIGLIAKGNPQQAGQEFITLLQDLDGQLKTALTNDQYTKVRSDIEQMIKGGKL